MRETAGNRKARRSRQGRGSMTKRTRTWRRPLALATAMTVGVAAAPAPLPEAQADINIPLITQDPVFTAGILAGLIAGLGVDNVTIPLNLSIDSGIIGIGTITIGDLDLVLRNVPSSPQSIYNSINGWNGWSTSGSTRSRFPATLGIGNGAYDTVNAYRAQLQSVAGDTPPGYTPFVPGPSGQTNFTSQALLLVQDPYRPNGGILTRFGPLLQPVRCRHDAAAGRSGDRHVRQDQAQHRNARSGLGLRSVVGLPRDAQPVLAAQQRLRGVADQSARRREAGQQLQRDGRRPEHCGRARHSDPVQLGVYTQYRSVKPGTPR